MTTPAGKPNHSRGVRPHWAPADIDTQVPNVARVYDYYLGGPYNFAADRRMAHAAMRDWPELPLIMRANRAFLRRAVRFLANAGIRQFLDLGSGIPTSGNVHEVAQSVDHHCRVVYVDCDAVAVAHSQALLADDPRAHAVHADLRHPAGLLQDPVVRDSLDLTEPVAVLLLAVLHFVPDSDDPAGIIAGYRDMVPSGSYLAVCHATEEGQEERGEAHRRLYANARVPMTMRGRAEIERLLHGFDVVEPGVVRMPLWRPDPSEPLPDNPDVFAGYAAVGRKP